MNFLKDPRTNWKYIIIVLVLAVVVGSGILGWIKQQEVPPTELPETEKPEEKKDGKNCVNDDDCVVFGKTRDCNCGCFNKDYKWESSGECFCLVPTSCKCVEGLCEGVFDGLEQACINSGGTVSTGLCCLSVGDFPDTCVVGACGCAPASSHEVKICDCGKGKCFNGETCVREVYSFNDCIKAGYPILESYPRQCKTPDGRTFTEGEEHCVAPTGESMSLFEAMQIAITSECGDQLKGYLEFSMCNADTGTWWMDLDIEKEGCNPACVVNIATKEAEINWRCMGVID
ncbi:MAG: hypothetical protein ACKKMS_00755 [Candidatus Nealsonbacteria bacterium]